MESIDSIKPANKGETNLYSPPISLSGMV